MKSSVLCIAAIATALFGNSTTPTAHAADSPQVAKNKQSARIWYEEAIVKKNSKSLDGILAKGVVVEFAPSYSSPVSKSSTVSGADQVKKHVEAATKAATFSGAIDDIIAEGNKVAIYRVVTSKMADGRTCVVPWVSFFEFDNAGKITKIKHVHDTQGEKQQLEKSVSAPKKPAPAKP